jgi:hypothetical protein
MVKTTYPYMWKYCNKWTLLAYGLFWFVPMHWGIYVGHFTWKRGKVPRLAYNDQKYTKFMNGRGARDKFLLGPALEVYPDMLNRLQMKYMKPFLRKHRYL